MIDLSNVTFIIPLRIETDDRLRNIILTSSFLLHHFNCKLLIKEVSDDNVFEKYAKPVIGRLNVNQDNLTYIFEKETREDNAFHRTKVLNDMIMMATTDIVVNYDCDIILPLSSYTKAINLLKSCDIVYPYRFGMHGERKVNLNTHFETQDDIDNFEKNSDISEFISSGYNPEVFDSKYFYYQLDQGEGWAEYGMCQFFNRQVYIDGYLENEGFIAYAQEDIERHYRWSILGYNIQRIDNYAYHLEHKRTPNSSFSNPFMKHNFRLWEYLKSLSKQELIDYYKVQKYYKSRVS